MGVSKVVYGSTPIIDITDSTVTADTLAEGIVAYGADGERITGIMSGGSKIATGTFTTTSTFSTNSTIVDINGLGFTPTYVLISATPNNNPSINTSGGTHLITAQGGTSTSNLVLLYMTLFSTLTNSVAASIAINSDGFSVIATNACNGIGLYTYIAIG